MELQLLHEIEQGKIGQQGKIGKQGKIGQHERIGHNPRLGNRAGLVNKTGLGNKAECRMFQNRLAVVAFIKRNSHTRPFKEVG